MTSWALSSHRWGAGPPVVFLYGLGASSRYVAPDLATSHCPVTALTGSEDTAAPACHLQAVAATVTHRFPALDVRIVDGDHHLAIHRTAWVRTILEEGLHR